MLNSPLSYAVYPWSEHCECVLIKNRQIFNSLHLWVTIFSAFCYFRGNLYYQQLTIVVLCLLILVVTEVEVFARKLTCLVICDSRFCVKCAFFKSSSTFLLNLGVALILAYLVIELFTIKTKLPVLSMLTLTVFTVAKNHLQ